MMLNPPVPDFETFGDIWRHLALTIAFFAADTGMYSIPHHHMSLFYALPLPDIPFETQQHLHRHRHTIHHYTHSSNWKRTSSW